MKLFTFFRRHAIRILAKGLIFSVILMLGYKMPESIRIAGGSGDEHIVYVKNPSGGPTLGYTTESGIKIIEVNGFFFKDLNKNGKLDPYEDWRLNADDRAKNLASL